MQLVYQEKHAFSSPTFAISHGSNFMHVCPTTAWTLYFESPSQGHGKFQRQQLETLKLIYSLFFFSPSFLCLMLFLRKCVKLKNNKAQISLFSSNLVLHTMPEVSWKENVIHNMWLWNQIRETHNLSVTSACKVKLQILYLLHINTLCFQILPPQALGKLWGPSVNSYFILDSNYTYINIFNNTFTGTAILFFF